MVQSCILTMNTLSVLYRVGNKYLAVFRFYERDILSGVVRIEKED